ncbi:MAG: tetratricopeptide repeat protein [Betaproteobacteria bacterium]|nr:tetratricopeptide repeat protein [Betaproteobacteria bacterium]
MAGAQFLCEQILQRAPRNPDALCLLAMSHLMNGRPAEAVPRFEQAIGSDPRHGMALEHLGLAHLLLGRFPEAERVLRRAAALPGAPASVSMRLGVSLLRQQKHDEAVRQLQRALALDPHSADCHLNLGQALAQRGDAAAAADHFQAALQIEPAHVDAMYNLGALALQRDELDQARHWFERALARSPQYIDAMVSLAVVLQRQAKLEQAREQYLATLRVAPGFTAAHEGLAFVCLALGRPGEAVGHLRATLEAEPANRNALSALAGALFEVGQLDEAEAVAQRACALDSSDAAAYGTLANIYLVRGELDRAIATLESGYAQTEASNLLGMLTYQLRQACDWTKWQAAWDRVAPEVERSTALGSPFWLLCEPTTAQQQLAYTRRWAEGRFKSITPGAHGASPAPRRHPRLRVGYLSSDLQEHAAAYLIAEVLELHDRERFEVFAYSHGPDDKGAMRPRLRAACEHFIDIAWEPDDAAAERIRKDELDILVDLKGYTAGDRLTIMARRPCEVQVTWLGYPGTTGAAFMDYLIADPFLIPPGEESAYSERIMRMPHCYQPNDRKRPVAEPLTRSDYGIPEHAFVFCCFNQTYKITPDIFAVWMRLLRNVPESVLWLVESNRWAKHNLLATAQAHGVAAERLVFAPRLPYARHLARYRVADLALDTFPYTSHTILSDALWCGCPTVGLCGVTFAARVSGSLLTAAGMPDLVTYTLDDYEQLAYRLAAEPSLLQEIRARVARARDHSPLFDSTTFTRGLESLYIRLVSHPKP